MMNNNILVQHERRSQHFTIKCLYKVKNAVVNFPFLQCIPDFASPCIIKYAPSRNMIMSSVIFSISLYKK